MYCISASRTSSKSFHQWQKNKARTCNF